VFREIALVIIVLSPHLAAATDLKVTADSAAQASAWSRIDRINNAVVDYKETAKPNPKNAAILNGLAWTLATKACELTNFSNPRFLATLAAAYAEVGDFTSAIRCQEQAIGLISPSKKQEFTRRLELYKADKPYRDSPKRAAK